MPEKETVIDGGSGVELLKVEVSKYTERELILLAQKQIGRKVTKIEVYATPVPADPEAE